MKALSSSSLSPAGRRLLTSDVFNGSTVKRAFRTQVIDIVSRAASSHRRVVSGNMITSSEGDEWKVVGGTVCRTPAFFGRPSRLIVETEKARTAILDLLNKQQTRTKRRKLNPKRNSD